MISFEFATANRVVFGVGALQKLGEMTQEWGKHALIVGGEGSTASQKVAEKLSAQGVDCSFFEVTHEPTISSISKGVEVAHRAGIQFVVGVGGGSAIDTGKAIAGMLTNPGQLLDYLEVVGAGRQLQKPALPLLAIPTTAGTGSEVTRNAVIGVPEKQVKVSLRSNYLLPRAAVIDPELTLSLPPAVTASTGMDALTQLIEPFVSKKANWLVDSLCRDGLRRMAPALLRAFDEPSDTDAREAMSYGSLLSGMALANAGLGAVHGFAGPIGGMFDAPHGAICAALLPAVVRMNIHVLQTRVAIPVIFNKYLELCQIIAGNPSASPAEGVEWLQRTRDRLAIPGLKTYGIQNDHFDEIIVKASAASSMKGNPVELTGQELREILEQSM